MKRLFISAVIAAATFTVSAFATDVGVSVTVGQPGFYGRIDIGDYMQPRLIYAQPVIVERGVMIGQPIYLRVPPGHAKNWKKHCHEYNACGEQVYFVHDDWYEHEYVPYYREKHGDHDGYEYHDKGKGHEHGKGHDK